MLPPDLKRTSALRRVPPFGAVRLQTAPGLEGDVCAFELAPDASPIAVEAASGRTMVVVPGEIFLATPGYRESTRWVVGGIPDGGLVPGGRYWVLADCGAVGDLVADSPLEKSHLGQVTYLGTVPGDDGRTLNIRQFAMTADAEAADHGAPVYLMLGTSSEVGKTTAGITVLRSLRQKGHAAVVALKATGTSSIGEIATYRDFGAAQAFDCVDFGLPTTYPSDRDGIDRVFEEALHICLSWAADAVLIECGGDMVGANVPTFLDCLKRRRPDATVVLVAADALAALGGVQVLQQMGLSPTLITGPCTDTPTLQQRTEALCGIPAVNMARSGGRAGPF